MSLRLNLAQASAPGEAAFAQKPAPELWVPGPCAFRLCLCSEDQRPRQQAYGVKQHSSPAAQQSRSFTCFAFTETQQPWGGAQHSSPLAQQSSMLAWVRALSRQQAWGGLQQSAFTAQQSVFTPETASLPAVPPPITPRRRARGASIFKDMESSNKSTGLEKVLVTRDHAMRADQQMGRRHTVNVGARRLTEPDTMQQLEGR